MLKRAGRDELPPRTVVLFKALAAAARVHALFKMPHSADECPIVAATLASGNDIFAKGKDASRVTMACQIVLEFRGKEQVVAASKLVEKQQGCLPAALWRELVALKGSVPAKEDSSAAPATEGASAAPAKASGSDLQTGKVSGKGKGKAAKPKKRALKL